MKRQRGESCTLSKDWEPSTSSPSRGFRTRMHRSSEFLNRDTCGMDNFRNTPNRDTEKGILGNRVCNSQAKNARRRRGVGLNRMRVSATIAVLAISSIAGTSGVTIAPSKATLEQAVDENLDVTRALQAYNMQQCKIALSVGDIDRDNLLSKSEYLRFVNQFDKSITNSQYIAVSDYDDLPQSLKSNFDSFSDPALSRIDISGAKPGQVPTSQQDTQLNNLCASTYSKLSNDEGPVPTDPPISNDPGPVADCSEAVDRGRCNVNLSISDTNRNDLLDQTDYVKFVNRLSSDQYPNTQFGQLPVNIKENYYRFATTDGQVNIAGSKPGQRVSVEQDIFLNAFCCETDLTVQNPGSMEDNSPTPATQAPALDLFFCQRSMASSDLNRDNGLSKDEYVTFLNRLTSNQFVGKTYDTLDAKLQANFDNLVGDNGKIDIYGSKPGQAANFQNENDLVNICVETGKALNMGSGVTPTPSPVATVKPTKNPTKSPTSSGPTSSQPTFPPGRSEVFNSFIISNKLKLKAEDLIVGTRTRDSLDAAYGTFVQNSATSFDGMEENLGVRSLRRRKLTVEYLPDSDEIYKIVNSACPAGLSPEETCQTVFARFQLTVEGENAQEVSKAYSDYTQKLISEGVLQTILETVDEWTPLTIVDASTPVTPPGNPNTNPPTSAPNTDNGSKKKGRGGSIAAGVIFLLLFVGAAVYVYFKGLPFDLPSKLLSFPFPQRKSARVGNQGSEEDEEEARLGLHDDDDGSGDDKNGFGKDFGPLGDDDDQKKNLFGFSTRKKNDDVDINYGLDSNADVGNSTDAGDDMYAFDEPSEIDSETDQDEQPSVSGLEDNVFDKRESGNWGTGNVFSSDSSAQGWGASGGEDNFFGTSAFEEQEIEEEEEEIIEEEEEITESESEQSEQSEQSEESESESESESFSSEDDTYQSGTENRSSAQESQSQTYEELKHNSFSGSSSADDKSEDSSFHDVSVTSSKMPSDLKLKNNDMDEAINNEDWDAVAEAAKTFVDNKSDADSMEESSKRMARVEETDEDIEDDQESYTDDSFTDYDDDATETSEDIVKREEYRVKVEELVKVVLPQETDKVDAMMEQFRGREEQLVQTLKTMEERNSNQRARAAIHKSKPPAQDRNESYKGDNSNSMHGEGSTAGSAAIAAASLPIPAEGEFDGSQTEEFEGDFGSDNVFGDEGEGSQYETQSYYSEEQGSASFYSEGEEELSRDQSYFSEDGSGTKSFFTEDEGSQDDEGSFYEEGASQEEYSQDENSQEENSQEEGSRAYSSRGSGSQEYSSRGSGSQGEKSFYSQGEEGEQSLAESYYSEGEGSQSYYSEDEGSFVSGEGEEGSFYSEGDENSEDDGDQIPVDTRRSY